jgi:hypothetical protein
MEGGRGGEEGDRERIWLGVTNHVSSRGLFYLQDLVNVGGFPLDS